MLRFRADCHSSFAVLSDTVLLDDVIHILIASAGEVDEHRTLAHRLCELHAVGNRVGAFDRGDDALHSGKLEESVERLIVVHNVILHSADVVQEGVLGAAGRVIKAACHGINGSRIAVFVLEHDALEAVHDALLAVGEAGGVVAELGTPAERLNAVEIDGVVQESGEQAHGVGAAAHAGDDRIGKLARHIEELLSCLNAHNALEIAHHHREGMGADNGTDAVDGVLVLVAVGCEGRVDRFLQRLQPVRDLDHSCAEDLHSRHVRGLLFDVHRAHIDVAVQAEVSGGGRQRNAMLPCAGLGDDLLLAHVLCKQHLAHAVVEFVRAGVVQILALDIELNARTDLVGESCKVGDRRGSALKLLADAAKLADELAGFADGLVGFADLVHGGLQLGRDIGAAIVAEIALGVGIVFEIGIKINIVKLHLMFLRSI
mgnify:CR=1 FL=1